MKHSNLLSEIMLKNVLQTLLPALLLLATLPTRAQMVDDTPTELADVLASVQTHFPLVLAARAEIAGKDALVQAAQGAFDPVIEGTLKNRLSGFYSGDVAESYYKKRFPGFGAEVFAGFRRSNGNFPVYENDLATTGDGETRFGISLSLWRDRDFDARRFDTASARVDALAERYRLQQVLIELLQESYIAYAQWLQAARLLSDYTELMTIAQARAEAVNRSVESGDAAEILAVDNNLAVLQRRSLVVDAQRLLDASAIKLSLFLRDADGSPRFPVYSDTLEIPEDRVANTADVEAIVDRVVALDPQIAMVRMEREQEELEVRLAENLAKPRVDLRFYNARDMGSGMASLTGSENVADISFSIPLATNTARGKANAARSRMTGLDYRIRQYSNEIRTELEVALVNLEATQALENIALEELTASLQLAEAESRRFEAGLSDFFQLNQREQVVAEAELKRWRAHFQHQVALANFYRVSLDLESLGLDPQLFNFSGVPPGETEF